MTSQYSSRESQLRSVLKAVTYRITGTITTGLITYAVTGEYLTALAIGSIEPFVKLVVYYVHERAWQRVPIGTIRRLAHLRSPPETEVP
jgi:uncharacterized membrane protein